MGITKTGWRQLAPWAVALSVFCGSQVSNATLLDDDYDPDFPLINYINQLTGATSFDKDSGAFSIDATTTNFATGPFGPPDFTLPSVVTDGDFDINVELDSLGNLVGGVAGPDLIVTGEVEVDGILYSGTLLSGEVSAFGFLDADAGGSGFFDEYDFRFRVTGGELASFYGSRIGVKVISEHSSFDNDFTESFAGKAKGTAGPLSDPCGISVEKTCLVLTPVSTDYQCSKPIDELTMVWTGPNQGVTIKAWKGQPGTQLLKEINNVMIGDEVSVSGYAGAPNDVFWEIFATPGGTKLGESNFHLSCSDDGMNGPEDCGMPQGDGKEKGHGHGHEHEHGNNSDLLNAWLLEGIVDEGGELNCTADSTLGSKECEVPSRAGERCEHRPTAISLRYHADDDCSASSNTQGDDKWSCNGVVAGEPVQIIVSKPDGNNVWLDTGSATVNDGDVVVATAANAGKDKFDSESRIRVLDAGGNLVQDIELHTSCSQNLRIGDRFGAIEVVGFVNKDQGSVQSGAEVKYSYVVKNTGGVDLTNIQFLDNGLNPGAVSGSLISVLLAGETAELMATVFVSDPIISAVRVSANTSEGSCSDRSRTRVTIAEPPPCEVSTGKFKLKHDKIKWKLTNDGDKAATIESIVLSAPEAFGAVKKIKLDGDIFKHDKRPMSWTFTDADFTREIKKRQIKPGHTKELQFETTQKDKTATASDISITVNFEEGCSVTFEPGAPGSQTFVCKDAKPIDSLSMTWKGPGPVKVTVGGGTQMQDNINTGDEVTFTGLSGMGNNLEWSISGAVEGSSEFHVSCSDKGMDGPDDCGSAQGDGKDDDADLINQWEFEGMMGTNGVGFDCSVLP